MSLLFSTRGTFTLSRFLSNAWNGLTRLWAFIRNEFSRHHIAFLFVFIWFIIRLAVSSFGSIFLGLYRFAYLSGQAISGSSSSTGGISFLQAFGIVNAIFPVQETFTLLGAILTLRGATWGYLFLRGVYKNLPFKAT